MDRQEQRHSPIAGRTRDGIDRCGLGEQKAGGGGSDCDTGNCRCAWRRGSFARAIAFGAAKRDTETNFSGRTNLRGRKSTRRVGFAITLTNNDSSR